MWCYGYRNELKVYFGCNADLWYEGKYNKLCYFKELFKVNKRVS